MKKVLPKISRKIKELILEEDAKIIDKKISKIALYSSIGSISVISQSQDSFALGGLFESHSSNYYHGNDDNFRDENLPEAHNGVNLERAQTTTGLLAKSITTVHSNHWNHSSETGSFLNDFFGGFINFISFSYTDLGGSKAYGSSSQGKIDVESQISSEKIETPENKIELLDEDFYINWDLTNASEADTFENSKENLAKGNFNKQED